MTTTYDTIVIGAGQAGLATGYQLKRLGRDFFVVDAIPGLYFCGLAFPYCFGSGEVNGVSRDAEYLARRIAARIPAPAPAAA